jgi:hypothetical protein
MSADSQRNNAVELIQAGFNSPCGLLALAAVAAVDGFFSSSRARASS